MSRIDKIIGHTKQKEILKKQILNNQLSHAYLFYGPKGIGKRTLAEAFAVEVVEKGLSNKNRKININHADILNIQPKEGIIKVSDIRNLTNETIIRPLEGDYRVIIINNADTMNDVAQNALLKTIEEPNEGNIFILITNNNSKLLETVKSRCQDLPFHDLTSTEKIEFLKQKGINEIPDDLSLTPGGLLQNLENPDKQKKFENYYSKFKEILEGNFLEIFTFSEEVAKDKNESIEFLEFLIRKLSNQAQRNNQPDLFILNTLDHLFELLEILSYNINLKLQWESSLIQIITEPK